MFTKENTLLERFTMGLSGLASHIELKNRIRYLDDNITAEQFVCRLMNILYDADYQSSNGTDGLTAGYDLILEEKQEIFQVSSACTGDKIDDANLKTRRAIHDGKLERGKYTLRFLFLTNNASKLKTCAAALRAKEELDFSFDPEKDILDFTTLCAKVKTDFQFVPERADKLREFMDYCSDVFPCDRVEMAVPQSRNRVASIIDEYARNFEEPLFMHTYTDSRVTLKQLYIAPAFTRYERVDGFQSGDVGEYRLYESRDLEGSLCNYVRSKKYTRERFLFIEGGAAIGKTSLVSRLCWIYRNQRGVSEGILGKHPLVCVRLRELDFQKAESAEQVLLHYLGIPDIATFEHCYPESLLVLDGADELIMVRGIPHGSVEEFLLELQRKFRSHKFLITTRPHFLNLEKFRSSLFQYRKIELLHYDEQMRAEWLKRYKACGQNVPEKTELFIRSFRGREDNGIVDTPLALYLLAQCDAESDLLGNQWALFRRIFSEAILKGEYNANFAESAALMDERSGAINYRAVQAIAFRIFRNASEERYYLTQKEIMEAISECNLEDLSPERVRETCVLCAYWKNVGSIGALEFYHNNIRDFFLCEYLCRHLIEGLKAPEPLEELVPMLCRVLCHADICHSTWRQVYEYLCLRLDFESVKPRTPDSLYHLIREHQDILRKIMPRVTAGRELWNTGNDSVVYRGGKQTFRNIYMLVRILQSFCPEKIELTDAEDHDYAQQMMELLREWDFLFYTPGITYTDHESITKSIDASSNTVYHRLGMSGQRLERLEFQVCCIDRSEFIRVILDRVNFSGSILENVAFSESSVIYGEFYGTRMNRITATDVTLTESFFNEADLHSIRGTVCLRQCRIYPGTILTQSELQESTFDDLRVKGMRIADCEFRRSRFKRLSVTDSVIVNTSFRAASFESTIRDTVFEDCDFGSVTFRGRDTFRNVIFRRCSLNYADLRGIDLSTVTFEDCDFKDADIPQLTEQ